MQTDEAYWTEFDQAYDRYAAARAAAGFPIIKPDKNAPLPSWVLRNGEKPKLTFVTRSPAPATPKVDRPKVTVTVDVKPIAPKPAGDKPMSKAETVRAMIRAAMAANKTIDDVIAQAKAELGMGNAQAKTYVTENWARVSKE